MDSLRELFSSKRALRDRYNDREAGGDPKLGVPTPSGSVGPGGGTLEGAQGAGGAMEPDPTDDR